MKRIKFYRIHKVSLNTNLLGFPC